jgi:hypothetical protein
MIVDDENPGPDGHGSGSAQPAEVGTRQRAEVLPLGGDSRADLPRMISAQVFTIA